MITLLLMFLACGDDTSKETTTTIGNTATEQVETTVTPKTTEVKETPVKNDNVVVEVKTAENTELSLIHI